MADEKLVRDGIPARLAAHGVQRRFRIAAEPEIDGLLFAKLHEEIQELHNAVTPDEAVEEMADVREVLASIARIRGADDTMIEACRNAKRADRGGFDRGLVLQLDPDLQDGAMNSNNERTEVRERLITRALADPRFNGVALCGSAAVGREDMWSDIDLVFGVAPTADLGATVADWTADMYHMFGSLHHVEIATGSAVYRAFLLPSALEVDLNFVPGDDFGARGPKFRLLSGSAGEQLPPVPAPTTDHYAGMGWLYAVQARSCIGRGKLWQAERTVAGIREQALALACLRHGLSALHGVDQLPQPLLVAYADCIVGAIDAAELRRAFRAVVTRFLEEVDAVDSELHERLAPTLLSLASISC